MDSAPKSLTIPPFPNSVLRDLLDVSLSALHLVKPIYAPDGVHIEDFSLDYVNLAGQRMTGLSEQPNSTLLTLFPSAVAAGIFDYYLRVYTSNARSEFEVNYQADGLDNYFKLSARRSGEWLVVSFTDTADQDRSAVEVALRESQRREQALRVEVEHQHNALRSFIEDAPVAVAVYRGPRYRVEIANATTLSIWDRTLPDVLGRPVFEVMPEAATPEVVAIFDRVYATGTAHTAYEQLTTIDRHGRREQVYWNFVFQPELEPDGSVGGIRSIGTEVTEQVQARQQVQQFNQDLEVRVEERTRQLAATQAEVLAAAQRRVQEVEELYQVLEQTPAAIAITRGPEHRYVYVNAAARTLFSGRELLGHTLAEALPETESLGLLALLNKVYETGETFTGTEQPIDFTSAASHPEPVRYFTFTYQAYHENGAVVGVSTFAYDVTEQVLARQREQESELQIRAIVEGVPFPINVCVGPDFRIQLANQAMLTAWGKGPSVFGQRFADVLPELAQQGVTAQFRQVVTSGEPLHLRNQRFEVVIHGTPQTFYYNYSLVPLRDSKGQVYGILNTAAEVTDLALAHQRLATLAGELQESEARFRTMADAAPNLVWAVHPDSSIRYINRAFLDFVGVKDEQEYLAAGWSEYVPAEEFEQAQVTLTGAIEQLKPYVMEHRMRRHDGEYRWLLSQGAPSYLQNGELYGYVGSAIDITELKQANEQLRRTNSDLDNFIYTASHDLKAPIANIEGLLYLLRDELPPAVATDQAIAPTLARMLDSVERFKRTITHLTEVSKLQKEYATPTAVVDVAAVVEDVRRDLQPLLLETAAQLMVAIEAVPWVQFSEKNLRSVVYNLLSNALKYRHPNRPAEVTLRARVQPGYMVLEVQDNGLGIHPDQVPRLFTMFQRFHTHVEGTGIGLYMVQRMVENAGGHVEVESQEDVGTTVSVYLPSLPLA
ncbi:PAS domain-containing sensor histidine kinase [Hymenobacter fodinae]|uniref:histidine kinase n=1 Tax=Hymenobacter fodinae TaxID=2510796 RepID=A0A4Z0P8U2_9BACT|nr:PAS domain-containing protein [Hymenobacter fodinae]TGE08783.1 PAS domain S-box protein [Hymenobacter fodinae]